MTLPPELLQRLADIEPPPAPDWHPLLLTGAIFLVLALLPLVWRFARRTPAPRRTALQRLRQLERQWRQGCCSERETAYRLAAILRLGLELESLRTTSEPARGREWQQFIEQLDELRYRPQSTGRLSTELFHKARRWLTEPRA